MVFAPVPRDYSFKLNKKEKRAALKSALTSRVQENKLIVVDELKFDEIKTKNFKQVMDNLKVVKGLVVINENDKNVVMSAKNLAKVNTTLTSTLNVYDIMKAGTVVPVSYTHLDVYKRQILYMVIVAGVIAGLV